MTIVFIENLPGSGHGIKIVEDFGDYAVHRDLAPGEHACIGVQRLKSLLIEEIALSEMKAPSRPALVPLVPLAPLARIEADCRDTAANMELRYA
jgi:hypothetical protein